MDRATPAGSNRFPDLPLPLILLLAAELAFLVGAHYVKAYSDPSLWLNLADRWMHGHPIGPWAPLYPVFLGGCLKLLGRVQVFWVNTPFVLGLTGLLCLLSARSLPRERGDREGGAGSGDGDASRRTLAGVLAAVLFVLFNRANLLELQNPYREALAFCLLMGGVLSLLSFLGRGGLWKAALSAALLGLATGVRETCGLLMFPAVLALLWMPAAGGTVPRWRGLAVFVGTLLLGLAPFLVHNAASTGRFWIPAYAAQKWMSIFSAHSGGFDIPVPGMSFDHFLPTGRRLLAYLLGKYTAAGVLLFGAGIVSAVRRRDRAILALFLPSVLVNLLFYACWHTVSWRLALVVDLFAIPVMAAGAVDVFSWAAARLNRDRPERVPALHRWAAWALAAAAAASLAQGATLNRDRLKVWQVADLRRFVLPQLEQPAVLTEPNHARQMLSWLLDLPCVDLHQPAGGWGGIDEMLAGMGVRNLAIARANSIYGYGAGPSPLLAQWFDVEPGPSLAGPPVPIETYGWPLTEGLFKVVPWRGREVRQSMKVAGAEADLLLVVDAGRPWDYAGRTFCRVYAGETALPGALSNGPCFFPVDRALVRDGRLDVRIVSDGPLPARVRLEAGTKNGEMRLPFRLGTNAWHYPLVPSGFTTSFSGAPAGFGLFRQGGMRLPKYGDAAFEMLAELQWTVGAPSGPPARVAIAGLCDALEAVSTGRPGAERSVISLGRGTGGLEWEPLRWDLRTSNTWVRVLEARVFAVPFEPAPSVRIDVGSAGDEAYLIEGFFRPETQGRGRTVRWSQPHSRVRLPVLRPPAGLEVTVRCLSVRPPSSPPGPSFAVNGRAIPADGVRVEDADGLRSYRFEVPADLLRDGASQMLDMTCTPWIPTRTGHGRDSRPLGMRVDSVEAGPSAPAGYDPSSKHQSP